MWWNQLSSYVNNVKDADASCWPSRKNIESATLQVNLSHWSVASTFSTFELSIQCLFLLLLKCQTGLNWRAQIALQITTLYYTLIENRHDPVLLALVSPAGECAIPRESHLSRLWPRNRSALKAKPRWWLAVGLFPLPISNSVSKFFIF